MASRVQRKSKPNSDLTKGAVESDERGAKSQVSMRGQLPHRTEDELLKEADTDFPEPGSNPEHTGELVAQPQLQAVRPIRTRRSPMIIHSGKTLREIAQHLPQAVAVFEHYNLDYCCMGSQTLREACSNAGVSIDEVESALDVAEKHAPAHHVELVNWSDEPLPSLIEHIQSNHHQFTRQQLDSVHDILPKVVASHGAAHPELTSLQNVFEPFRSGLLDHMQREEQQVFSGVRQLYASYQRRECAEPLRLDGELRGAVTNLQADHQRISADLKTIRALSHDYVFPDNACIRCQAMFDALQQLEQNLRQHLHLENNILFPRALELERKVEQFIDVL